MPTLFVIQQVDVSGFGDHVAQSCDKETVERWVSGLRRWYSCVTFTVFEIEVGNGIGPHEYPNIGPARWQTVYKKFHNRRSANVWNWKQYGF
jgi:hypothetical protein